MRPKSAGTPITSNPLFETWFPRSRKGSRFVVHDTSEMVEAAMPSNTFALRESSAYSSTL